MIGYLRGRLVHRNSSPIVVDVGGVGYEVEVHEGILADLPATGGEVELHTHLASRDDRTELYGFAGREQLEVFRTLIKISGVGPRMAMSVLAALRLEDLRRAIADGDEKAFVRVQGVGPKTARRILVDLRGSLEGLELGEGAAPAGGAEADLALALENLGYGTSDARRTAREHARRHPDAEVAELLRLVLRKDKA